MEWNNNQESTCDSFNGDWFVLLLHIFIVLKLFLVLGKFKCFCSLKLLLTKVLDFLYLAFLPLGSVMLLNCATLLLQTWLECARVWTKPPASPPSPTERCPRGPSISWTCPGSWWRSRCGERRWGTSVTGGFAAVFTFLNIRRKMATTFPGGINELLCSSSFHLWLRGTAQSLPPFLPPTDREHAVPCLFIWHRLFQWDLLGYTRCIIKKKKKRMAVL